MVTTVGIAVPLAVMVLLGWVDIRDRRARAGLAKTVRVLQTENARLRRDNDLALRMVAVERARVSELRAVRFGDDTDSDFSNASSSVSGRHAAA